MYQSSTRNNFLDILADPTTIALLGSIALHAIIGASLPLFSQLEKEGKKAEPGTVKVVELTPNELQRIPQAAPIPTPRVLAPVTPTITPSPKVAKSPSIPPISTNSPTIPFSPIRIPLEQVNPQPVAGTKQPPAIPQKQPNPPIIDPNISFKPAPKPNPKPATNNVVVKPLPVPKPAPAAKQPQKILTNPDPSLDTALDDDGGDTPPTTSATTPNTQAQTPPNSTPTTNTPNSNPPAQSSTQLPGSGEENNSSWIYGKHATSARERIEQYLKSYPDIKLYKPQLLSQSYPVGVPCSKVKQAPFIVLMAAFDKVPENSENNPLGDSTAPTIDKPYVAADLDTPENRKLSEIAINTALYEANKADQNRPAEDKGKRVLYQYRVQFDPTTCKQ